MSATKVLHVARREFLARVRSKAFIISTLALPAIMGLWGLVAGVMTRADLDELRLSVLDVGTGLGESLATRLRDVDSLPIFVEEVIAVEARRQEEVRQELSAAVRAEQIDGYLVLAPDADTLAWARYYAAETGNPVILSTLEDAVTTAVLESWIAGEELERVRRVQRADLQAVTISAEGEEVGGFLSAYLSTFVLGFLMYMMVMMHGQQMAMAIVEEKSSRLIELIIGAVTTVEFMAGKILGVLAAGILQLLIWLAMAAVALLWVLPGMAMASAMAEVDLSQFFDPGLLFFFALFLTMGYLMYVTLFAAVGATCTSNEELQHALFPAMLPVLLAFFSIFYIMSNPNTLAARVLSLFPFFTPITMFARINVSEPAGVEVGLSIVLLAVTLVGCVWAAAKVFRVAILMHGKRPSFGDLWRMVRAA